MIKTRSLIFLHSDFLNMSFNLLYPRFLLHLSFFFEIYLFKKIAHLSWRVSHNLHFVDCIPMVQFNMCFYPLISSSCKLLIECRSLVVFRVNIFGHNFMGGIALGDILRLVISVCDVRSYWTSISRSINTLRLPNIDIQSLYIFIRCFIMTFSLISWSTFVKNPSYLLFSYSMASCIKNKKTE